MDLYIFFQNILNFSKTGCTWCWLFLRNQKGSQHIRFLFYTILKIYFYSTISNSPSIACGCVSGNLVSEGQNILVILTLTSLPL